MARPKSDSSIDKSVGIVILPHGSYPPASRATDGLDFPLGRFPRMVDAARSIARAALLQ